MTTFASVLLVMLEALTPFHRDHESPNQRHARMVVISNSIARATEEAKTSFKGQPEELAMGLFTIGKFEARFALHVHADLCKPWECDVGKAKSLFQVHVSKTVPREVWATLGGTSQEATDRSAMAAASMWARAWRCGTPERAFAGYMSSHCGLKLSGARERAIDYQANLKRFRQLMKGQ